MQPEAALKVAIVVPVGRSGYLFFAISLCRALSLQGADVTLITSRNCDEIEGSNSGFRVLKMLGGMDRRQPRPLRGLDYGLSVVRLRRLLRREKFDLACFQDTFVPYVDAPFFRTLNGRPKTVFIAHDPDPESISTGRAGFSIRRPVLGWLYRGCDHVIVMSSTAGEEIIGRFGVPAPKVTRIAHGNYESYRTAEMPAKSAARRLLSIPADSKLVLFFGSLKPSKGIEHLVKAFAQLRRVEPTAHLLIVGEPLGIDVEACERLIASRGLDESATFRPQYVPPEGVADYFAAADLVALPYLRVYQSGVLHLAYSFGRPVVATRVGGLAEDVVEGKSGLLIPPGDDEALAEALREMLSDPERLEQMGAYAKRLSESVYSWDGIARDVFALCRRVVEDKAA